MFSVICKLKENKNSRIISAGTVVNSLHDAEQAHDRGRTYLEKSYVPLATINSQDFAQGSC